MIWLDILAETVERHKFRIFAYCLMPNHFHILLQTIHPNLSEGMHMLNATYCQHFNHRHGLSGHVIQGRFHAVNVDKNSQLLAVARYVSLNPVRARLVQNAADWLWGSHRHYLDPANAPEWLNTSWLLSQFGNGDLAQGIAAYKKFIDAGIGLPDPLTFHAERPNPQRENAQSLYAYAEQYTERDEAMARAYQSTAYTRQEIAHHFGVSIKTVSRAIQEFNREDG